MGIYEFTLFPVSCLNAVNKKLILTAVH